MTSWDEVLASALVGTERRPLPAGAPGRGASTDADLDVDADGCGSGSGEGNGSAVAERTASPEDVLLGAAAILGARRAAGWLPTVAGPLPPPAPDDDTPECSPTAGQVLALLLAGELALPGGSTPLIGEWLERAARVGRRPPRRLLPAVLDLATRRPGVRAVTVAAVGPIGLWLAAANPAWRLLLPGPPPADGAEAGERFARGTRAEREAVLAAVRAEDPAAGLDLLGSTWATDAAADRAAFVALLAPQLSMADEPFLEAALDDRARSVRDTAAAVLNRLPGSRRAARMTARLAPLVAGDRADVLAVAFPGEPDAGARRDGLTDAAPQGLGRRAWWLVQLVAATPLDWWTATLATTPAELVVRAPDELVLGWQVAAGDQGDQRWASAVFARAPVPALVGVLGPEIAPGALEGLARSARVPAAVLLDLLEALPTAWPPALSSAVVARLAASGRTHLTAAPLLARRLHPAAVDDVEAWSASLGRERRARRELAGVQHALTLRQTMAEELT